jgi:hypothetical protein
LEKDFSGMWKPKEVGVAILISEQILWKKLSEKKKTVTVLIFLVSRTLRSSVVTNYSFYGILL